MKIKNKLNQCLFIVAVFTFGSSTAYAASETPTPADQLPQPKIDIQKPYQLQQPELAPQTNVEKLPSIPKGAEVIPQTPVQPPKI